MEEYENLSSNSLIGHNAYDASDATAAITERKDQEVERQDLQIMCQKELEIERNQLGNPGVFEPTSKNAGIQKATTDTCHGVKKRSSNSRALKMIVQ